MNRTEIVFSFKPAGEDVPVTVGLDTDDGDLIFGLASEAEWNGIDRCWAINTDTIVGFKSARKVLREVLQRSIEAAKEQGLTQVYFNGSCPRRSRIYSWYLMKMGIEYAVSIEGEFMLFTIPL